MFKSAELLRITNDARTIMPCISLQSKGVKFIFDSQDNLIPNEILAYGKPYAEDEMTFFYNISPKFENGYFLDIGANVGTTSIYFKKKFAKNLKYIAFEPLKVNYKYLKINSILNDCEEIKAENIGLSNVNEDKKMLLFDGAFGSSMVSESDEALETCQFITLDKYIYENRILPEDIAYIWVDVQCHELEMIEGGIDTLSKSKASLYIEFNIEEYRQQDGKVDKFLKTLSQIYTKFICYEQYAKGKKQIRDITEVFDLPNEINISFCNILFMK